MRVHREYGIPPSEVENLTSPFTPWMAIIRTWYCDGEGDSGSMHCARLLRSVNINANIHECSGVYELGVSFPPSGGIPDTGLSVQDLCQSERADGAIAATYCGYSKNIRRRLLEHSGVQIPGFTWSSHIFRDEWVEAAVGKGLWLWARWAVCAKECNAILAEDWLLHRYDYAWNSERNSHRRIDFRIHGVVVPSQPAGGFFSFSELPVVKPFTEHDVLDM